MRRIVTAVAAALLLGGCYNVSYATKAPGSGKYEEQRGDFFLWGLVGNETIDLRRLCPGGVSRWRSQQTFVDGLIGVVTLGIYIPRHVKVECAGGAAYQLELDADTAARLAAAPRAPHAG